MANVYEYTGINGSQTMTVIAGVEIEGAPCRAVKLVEGKAVLAAEGEMPAGILLLSSEQKIPAGTECSVQIKDIGLWKAGTAFFAGDMLAVDADGLCQKAATGQYMYARALEDATASGDMVRIQIVNAGYEKSAAAPTE